MPNKQTKDAPWKGTRHAEGFNVESQINFHWETIDRNAGSY